MAHVHVHVRLSLLDTLHCYLLFTLATHRRPGRRRAGPVGRDKATLPSGAACCAAELDESLATGTSGRGSFNSAPPAESTPAAASALLLSASSPSPAFSRSLSRGRPPGASIAGLNTAPSMAARPAIAEGPRAIRGGPPPPASGAASDAGTASAAARSEMAEEVRLRGACRAAAWLVAECSAFGRPHLPAASMSARDRRGSQQGA